MDDILFSSYFIIVILFTYDIFLYIILIYNDCYNSKGSKIISNKHKNIIYQIGTILNISWLLDAAETPVDIICQRSTNCQRLNNCENFPKSRKKISWTNQIKDEILKNK